LRFLCKISFLEIYQEVITDLLQPASTRLQIREDLKRGVHVEGLSEEVVVDGEDIIIALLVHCFICISIKASIRVASTHLLSIPTLLYPLPFGIFPPWPMVYFKAGSPGQRDSLEAGIMDSRRLLMYFQVQCG
jgi:hypothetical protein